MRNLSVDADMLLRVWIASFHRLDRLNIEYWFRKLNYYETSSQSITFVFLFHPKTEQQHQGYGSRIPSNHKGRNFVGLNEVDSSYFLRRFFVFEAALCYVGRGRRRAEDMR